METNDDDNNVGGQQVHKDNNDNDDVNVVGMAAEDGQVNETEDYPLKDGDGDGEGNYEVYSGAAPRRKDTIMAGTEVKISSEVPPPNDDDNYGDDEGDPEDDEEDGEILE
mmetsp:Transcript_21225/g.29539  ORF Transcript_21225/g.29539 Transcript_21225/m.29539 type:complete len:110 (-) Transcript_21225:92-421(-)